MNASEDSLAPAPKLGSGGSPTTPEPVLAIDTAMSIREQMLSDAPEPRRHPNIRRSAPGVRLFYLLSVIVMGITAAAYWLYVKEIKPALAQLRNAPESGTPNVVRAVEIQLPEAFRNDLAGTNRQIGELQQQIDSFRALQAKHEQRLDSLTDRLHALPTGPAALTTPESAGVTSMTPNETAFGAAASSPALAELRLLKERNRLTAFADEAISTGNRRPLDLIIEAMKDPAKATLYHAAKAECYRVVGHFHLMNRIDPGYKLPVQSLFPDQSVRDEADIKTEQLIGLLADQSGDWQVRLRAAFLLGGRRTLEVGEALLDAMKNDTSLDVAKEAQLSFQQNMGRHFLLYDLPTIESWWDTQTVHRPAEESKP